MIDSNSLMKAFSLLTRMAVAMEARAGRSEKLGFVSGSDTKYVYIGGESSLWYYRENETNIPIANDAVIGHIIALESKTKEYKGEERPKLQVTLDCGDAGKICLVSGLETVFARSLLLKLRLVPQSVRTEPVKIIVRSGDTEGGKTVFASVVAGREFIKAEWDKDTKVSELLSNAQSVFFGNPAISPAPTTAINLSDRSAVDRAISSEFNRLCSAGWHTEELRAIAIKKFPDFKTSRHLDAVQAAQLLEILQRLEGDR